MVYYNLNFMYLLFRIFHIKFQISKIHISPDVQIWCGKKPIVLSWSQDTQKNISLEFGQNYYRVAMITECSKMYGPPENFRAYLPLATT